MNQRLKLLTVFALCSVLLTPQFSLAEVGQGASGDKAKSSAPSNKGSGKGRNAKGQNSNGAVLKRVLAKLVVSQGVQSSASGKFERKAVSRSARSRRQLVGKVHVPVPSIVPAVGLESDLAGLVLEAIFIRDSVPYAECFLAFDRIKGEDEGQNLRGEYKLDIRYQNKKKGAVLSEKKGTCDIDLSVEGVQAGYPDVIKGDTLEVRDAVPNTFLSGEFK